jgi:hypothetical protein
MTRTKTFIFPQIVHSVAFVHCFDEHNLGTRGWNENTVRVVVEGETEQEIQTKMAEVDKIAKEAGGWAIEGEHGTWGNH